MYFSEMKKALDEAEITLKSADSIAGDMAKLLVGRLRKTGNSYQSHLALKNLKRELKDYNIRTGKWKS